MRRACFMAAAAIVGLAVAAAPCRPQDGRGAQPVDRRIAEPGPPRTPSRLPRRITPQDVAATPAEGLAFDRLNAASILDVCPLARAGATVNSFIDGQALRIDAENAEQVEKRLEERRVVATEAIRRRGSATLAAGYIAKTAGECDAWGLGDGPVLVEQDGCDVFISQGGVRHMGVVVESAVAMRHDMNTDIRLRGTVSGGELVFVTPDRGGLDGTAKGRCTWTLVPRAVEGPEWADAFVGRAIAHRSSERYAAAIQDLETAVRLQPDPVVAGLQAFMLATCPDDAVRDGKRALRVAEQAEALAGGVATANVLLAQAAAHAEVGDFPAAVDYQKRGIEVCSDAVKPVQRERLRAYEARKPYREPRMTDRFDAR